MAELIVPSVVVCEVLKIQYFELSARLVKMKLKTGQVLQLPRKLFANNDADPFVIYNVFSNNQSLIKVK